MVEANTESEPLHYLSFPMFLCSNAPNTSPVRVVASRSTVGTLWRSKYGSENEQGVSHPVHFQASPWHIAPLHLPLAGQNIWPHMASGFSATLWIRPVKNNEEDRPTHEGKEELSRDVLFECFYEFYL